MTTPAEIEKRMTYYDDQAVLPRHAEWKRRTARKEWTCRWCSVTIEKGTAYRDFNHQVFQHMRICEECYQRENDED